MDKKKEWEPISEGAIAHYLLAVTSAFGKTYDHTFEIDGLKERLTNKIKCGDIKYFNEYVKELGFAESDMSHATSYFMGMKVEVNDFVPKDMAILVDKNNNVLQILKLK